VSLVFGHFGSGYLALGPKCYMEFFDSNFKNIINLAVTSFFNRILKTVRQVKQVTNSWPNTCSNSF